MLDPVKVSLLAPGIDEKGEFENTGVPGALINAYFSRFGIVPTRVTDFQVMFLFAIGIIKGKWGTLLSNLLSFKRDYDANRSIADVLPEIAALSPARYRNVGLHALGDEMFEYLRTKRPGDLLNAACENLPAPDMTPREAYERLVRHQVETVPVEKLAQRTAVSYTHLTLPTILRV